MTLLVEEMALIHDITLFLRFQIQIIHDNFIIFKLMKFHIENIFMLKNFIIHENPHTLLCIFAILKFLSQNLK
jgi:hypothetical protein